MAQEIQSNGGMLITCDTCGHGEFNITKENNDSLFADCDKCGKERTIPR